VRKPVPLPLPISRYQCPSVLFLHDQNISLPCVRACVRVVWREVYQAVVGSRKLSCGKVAGVERRNGLDVDLFQWVSNGSDISAG
jgi:hypothetical protein